MCAHVFFGRENIIQKRKKYILTHTNGARELWEFSNVEKESERRKKFIGILYKQFWMKIIQQSPSLQK